MTDTITLTGLVATIPRHLTTSAGLPLTSFRLASTQRRFDRAKNSWVDGETNWYTVTAFRQLATNVVNSLNKGERVVVTGRLRLREWATNERSGTNIEVDADAIGHDLSWGTASFTRVISGAMVVTAACDASTAGGVVTSFPTDYSTNLTESGWPARAPGDLSENGSGPEENGTETASVGAAAASGEQPAPLNSAGSSTGSAEFAAVEVPF